jgi:hypothetical protein
LGTVNFIEWSLWLIINGGWFAPTTVTKMRDFPYELDCTAAISKINATLKERKIEAPGVFLCAPSASGN